MFRILSLGLDKSALDPNSKTAKRIVEYKNLVEEYIVLVPSDQLKIYALFDLYQRSRKIIGEENINLITTQDQYFIGLLGYLLAKKYGIGLEVQIHGFEKFSGIRKLIAKFVISHANSIRTVGQRLKNLLIKEFGVSENKITVVPIHVEIPNTKYQISRVKKDSKFIFLTVSRLVPIKNISLQINAFKEVINKYPQAELWIVGDGPERNKLNILCQKLNVEDKVLFFGWQDDLVDYYSQADVFLLTSNSEGWGMAVIEAASYGLPIIMTNVGLAEEVIINNESGFIVPVGDRRALTRAMFKIIEDQDLRARLAKGAIEAVKKLSIKEEILKLYKQSWQKAINY